MTTEIRKITEAEIDDYIALTMYAFNWHSDAPVSEIRRRRMLPDHSFAALVDGQLAAGMINHRLVQNVRGVRKPMSGIGNVATYPEYRRQGLIRALFEAVFADMREQGQAVSGLYPFSEPFYRKFGYVAGHNKVTVRVPTTTLAGYLPLATSELGDGWRFERLNAAQAQAQLMPLYALLAEQHHGYVYNPAMVAADWVKRHEDRRAVLLWRGDELTGGAIYQGRSSATGGEMAVFTLGWRTLAARDRMLGFLALHGSAAEYLWLELAPDTNWQRLFIAPSVPYEMKPMYPSLMTRVVDVVGALNDLPAPVPGELRFSYRDPWCPWQDGTYVIRARGGRLLVERTDSDASLQLGVKTLSALVFGTLPVAELLHRGWLPPLDEDTAALLGAWFPAQFMYATYYF